MNLEAIHDIGGYREIHAIDETGYRGCRLKDIEVNDVVEYRSYRGLVL